MNHLVCISCAQWHALRARRHLDLSYIGLPRYVLKTFNLSVCFAGFCDPRNSGQARRAGIASFLSCAYDVLTDWSESPDAVRTIGDIASGLVPEDLVNELQTLIRQDLEGAFQQDPLARGVKAFELSFRYIRPTRPVEHIINPVEIGSLMQIVDDVIDLRRDTQRRELNCLSTVERAEHLSSLVNRLSERTAHALFPAGWVLRLVIRRARTRAARLLAIENGTYPQGRTPAAGQESA